MGIGLLSAALALPLAGAPAQAETAPERGLVSLKYLDYLDRQPGARRIAVRTPSLLVQAPITGDWLIGGSITSDAISGASPSHHTTALKNLRDERHAVDAELTRYFANASLTVGANYSNENDYLSRGLALAATRSSDNKNTTWTAGVGINADVINPTNHIVDHERKHVTDLLVGVTQVLSSTDIVQLNLGWSRGRGYFSDPYKVFDNRPREHDRRTLLARWNHHLESTGGTVRTSYRYYNDNFGIDAHTLGLEYVQPLPGWTPSSGWTVTPAFRLYTQNAARFYVDAGPPRSPFAPNPPIDATYFTEDQRLSAFGAHTLGVKIARQVDADWAVDLKLEHYTQRAAFRIGGSGSPGLAPFYARIIQLGVSRQF